MWKDKIIDVWAFNKQWAATACKAKNALACVFPENAALLLAGFSVYSGL